MKAVKRIAETVLDPRTLHRRVFSAYYVEKKMNDERKWTDDQVVRLMELAACNAAGTAWGSGLIANEVFNHYSNEDGKVRTYVDSGKDFDAAVEEIQ